MFIFIYVSVIGPPAYNHFFYLDDGCCMMCCDDVVFIRQLGMTIHLNIMHMPNRCKNIII